MGDGDEADEELSPSDVELQEIERCLFRAIREDGRANGPLDDFQTERSAIRVRPLVKSLMQLAESSGWRPEDVVLWACSPTTYFEDESRPIDHFESDPELVLEVARRAWGVEW